VPVDVGAQRRNGLVVAIDGPSGSGKSSVSREVAARLGLRYLDTGAMYRAVTWSALAQGLDLDADPAAQAAVAVHARSLALEISTDPQVSRVAVAGIDITSAIREHRISAAVSGVATNLGVRAELVERQRAIIEVARDGAGIVAEGRDITTVVAPDAEVRILLTADARARLERRAIEMHGEAGEQVVAEMHDLVLRRDADDSTVATFHVPADGVVELDSSGLSFDETVNEVLAAVRAANGTVSAAAGDREVRA
jgi:cytidylate kinase